jgi:Tfp pilus assembly protein PilX
VRDERGFALPLVLGVMILVFLLVTALLSQSLQARHSTMTDWQMLRAQYAAESGVARMQETLCQQERLQPLTTRMNGMEVNTNGVVRNGVAVISSTASGRGVKQSVRVWVDQRTCTVIRWER